MTADRETTRQPEVVEGEILEARVINPEPEPNTGPNRFTPKEPVLWHIVLFGFCATLTCLGLTTLLLGDISIALTVSATLLAAIAVRAFLAFED